MTHELKIMPEYFQAVRDGVKDFEIRYNDRDYKVGDNVVLREFDGDYTDSDPIERRIKYIYDGNIGLQEGFCILGLENPAETKRRMITCPRCGLESRDFRECPRCGMRLPCV